MTASSQCDANTKGGLLQNEILEPLFNDDAMRKLLQQRFLIRLLNRGQL